MSTVGDRLTPRPLGSSGLVVTPLGIGGSPLGGAEGVYGHDTAHEDAVATVLRTLDGPLTLLDTSNAYGEGRSEERIGEALRRRGGAPSGFVIATKVDADPRTRAYGRDRVLRSFEESMRRLGLERVQLLHLHDPESDLTLAEATAPGGAIEGLLELKAAGLADAIGIAGGAATEMAGYVETGVFDVLLTHNRWSLVDRTGDALIDLATARGMGVINAAPFGGGLLARRPRPDDRYAYGLGTAEQVRAAIDIADHLDDIGIPLAAAALQFSLRDPRIHNTLIGASRPERVDDAVRLAEVEIPDEVWDGIERRVPPRAAWIDD